MKHFLLLLFFGVSLYALFQAIDEGKMHRIIFGAVALGVFFFLLIIQYKGNKQNKKQS